MKRFPLVFVCLLTVSIGSLAQTAETFDLATFRSPVGWQRQEKDGVLIFNTSNEQKGTYAMIMIYRSGNSSGNAKGDFEADWHQFIAGQLGVKGKPEAEPTSNVEGWEVITGGAAFENEMGTSAALLKTYSGYGRAFSMATLFNTQDYLPVIEAFAASVKLSKPQTSSQSSATAGTDSATSIVGTWAMGASGTQKYGDYKNPYSVNNYGYIKAQYTFNGNGTYSFVSKTFKMTFDKLLLIRESGTYQINGNAITISPQKSVIQAWSKRDGTDKWGRLLTTQNRALEKVTYLFTRHYFSGIDQWNLVLQADKPTERDGPFSGNTTFTNAYYYAPISPNNLAIDLPN